MDGDSDYVKNSYNFRSNMKNLDLNTIAGMNSIVRGLTFLSSLLGNHNIKYDYIGGLNQDVVFKTRDCRRLWDIDDYAPIDIINVCLNKFDNITIVFFDADDNMSGSSLTVNDEMIIFVNSKHSLGRQRFTIAHELYHLLYGENEFINCSLNSDDEVEKSADQFASHLLMSDVALLNYKRENNITNWELDDVLACEQYFQISRKAMLQRLMSIGEIDYNQYKKYSVKIRYNAKKRGFDIRLYCPYSKDNLLMGNYVKLTRDAYDQRLITKGRRDELLRDAFYYNFLNNEDMEDLIE